MANDVYIFPKILNLIILIYTVRSLQNETIAEREATLDVTYNISDLRTAHLGAPENPFWSSDKQNILQQAGDSSQEASQQSNNAPKISTGKQERLQIQAGNRHPILPEQSKNTSATSASTIGSSAIQEGNGPRISAEDTDGAGDGLDVSSGNSSSVVPSGRVAVVIVEEHIVTLNEATASPADASGRGFPQKALAARANGSPLSAEVAKTVVQHHYWPFYLTLSLLVLSVFCTCLLCCDTSGRRNMTAPPKYSPPEPLQYGYPFSYAMRTAEPTAAAAQVH